MFYDTYALFEIVSKNPRYIPYLERQMMTTRQNLLELHYGILKIFGKATADTYFDAYLPYAQDISDDDLKEASAFRSHMKGYRFSYIDCVGYVIAKRLDIPFLTGDKAFKGLPGVEFVK